MEVRLQGYSKNSIKLVVMRIIFSEPQIEKWYEKFKEKRKIMIKTITKPCTVKGCPKNLSCAHLILTTAPSGES